MGRKNSGNGRRVRVTREVYALAVTAAHRAAEQEQEHPNYLPSRVFGSRRISRRMYKALKAQAA